MSGSWRKEVISVPSDKAPVTRIKSSAHAVRVGPMVFVTGQSGRHLGEDAYSDDPAEQARQTILNLKAILEESGSSLENVIKRTVIVSDMDKYALMRPVIESYFTSPVASTTIQANFVHDQKVIEIDLIAVVDEA
jgi:2-iminobutanoate/2-iminopropanoate deaminase